MYKYVCERIIPGCTYTVEAETRDKLMKEVRSHLREHHDLDHRDERIAKTLRDTGIFYVRHV